MGFKLAGPVVVANDCIQTLKLMTAIQKFFTAVLPTRWAEHMKRDSQAWHIYCTGCGYSRSVWDCGGIRWKAKSYGKRTLVRCPNCGLHAAGFEKRAPQSPV